MKKMTNKEVFINNELVVLKDMYVKFYNEELPEEEIKKYGFLNKDYFTLFYNTFEPVFNHVVNEATNIIEESDMVKFIERRLYWVTIYKRNKNLFGLDPNMFSDNVKVILASDFDDIYQVEEFQDKGWDNYDVYDIKNKLIFRSIEQIEEYLDRYKYIEECFPNIRKFLTDYILNLKSAMMY